MQKYYLLNLRIDTSLQKLSDTINKFISAQNTFTEL